MGRLPGVIFHKCSKQGCCMGEIMGRLPEVIFHKCSNQGCCMEGNHVPPSRGYLTQVLKTRVLYGGKHGLIWKRSEYPALWSIIAKDRCTWHRKNRLQLGIMKPKNKKKAKRLIRPPTPDFDKRHRHIDRSKFKIHDTNFALFWGLQKKILSSARHQSCLFFNLKK